MGTGGREYRVGVPFPVGLRARAHGAALQPPRLRAGVGMWLCVCGRMGRSSPPGWGEGKGESGPVLHAPRIPRRGRSLSARLYGWGTCSVRGAGAVSSRPSQQSGASRHPRHPRHGPPHRYRGAGGQRGAGAGGEHTEAGGEGEGVAWQGGEGGKGVGAGGGSRGSPPGAVQGAVQGGRDLLLSSPFVSSLPHSSRPGQGTPPRAGDTPPTPLPWAEEWRGERRRESGFCEGLVITERVNSARKIIQLLIAASALVPSEPGYPSAWFGCWASPLSAVIELQLCS